MTKIEVGDILKHETGNEYTVLFMGDTHGVAKLIKPNTNSLTYQGAEMSFHANITTSSIWTHRKVMPSIRTTYFIVWSDDGSIEEVDDAVDGWEYVAEEDSPYVTVIRVNPDQTWGYVNADDEVIQ